MFNIKIGVLFLSGLSFLTFSAHCQGNGENNEGETSEFRGSEHEERSHGHTRRYKHGSNRGLRSYWNRGFLKRNPKEINILTVCGGNTGRSRMMEALFNKKIAENRILSHRAKEIFKISSAGVNVNPNDTGPEELAVSVLKNQFGASIDSRGPKALTKDAAHAAQLILTATAEHFNKIKVGLDGKDPIAHNARKVIMLSQCAGQGIVDIEDPHGKEEEVYLKVAKQIEGYVTKIVNNRMRCLK